MGTFTDRLAILIEANGTQAISEFKKVGAGAEADLGKAEASAGRLGTSMMKAGAGMVVGGALGLAAAKKLADAYANAHAAEMKLDSALANQPKLAGANKQAFLDLADSIASHTVVANQDVVAGEAFLAQQGLTQSQILKTTPLVVDLARTYGLDLEPAAKKVALAINGKTRGLQALIGPIDKATTASGRYAAVQRALNDSVAGYADREGKTFAGQLEITKNKLQDLEEGVGKGAVEAFGHLLGGVQDVTDALGHLGGGGEAAAGQILTYVSATALLVGGFNLAVGGAIKFGSNLDVLKAKIGLTTVETEGLTVAEVEAGEAGAAMWASVLAPIAAVVAAFAVAGYGIDHLFKAIGIGSHDAEFSAKGLNAIADGMDRLGKTGKVTGQFDEIFKQAAAFSKGGDGPFRVGAQKFTQMFDEINASLDKSAKDGAWNDFRSQLAALRKQWIDSGGDAAVFDKGVKSETDKLDAATASAKAHGQTLDSQEAAQKQVATDARVLGQTLDDQGKATDRLTPSQAALAKAYGISGDAAKKLETQAKSLIDAQYAGVEADLSMGAAHSRTQSAWADAATARQHLTDVTQGYAAGSKEAKDAQSQLDEAVSRSHDADQSLADARSHLNDVTRGYSPASDEYKSAMQSLESAQDSAESSTQSLTDAQQKLNDLLSGHAGSSDALDATSAAADAHDAVANALDARNAAQDRLNNPQKGDDPAKLARDAAKAQRDYEKAQRDATKADQHASDINNGYAQSSKEVQDAQRGVTAASQQNQRAQQALADATQKADWIQRGYPAGSKEVVDAQNGVRTATKDAADAHDAEAAAALNAQNILHGYPATSQEVQDAKQAMTDKTNALAQATLDEGKAALQAAADRIAAQALIDNAEKHSVASIQAAIAQVYSALVGDPNNPILQGQLSLLQGELHTALYPSNNPYSGRIPGRAKGGKVTPSNWYWVGEQGPELFSPDGAGTVHSSDKSAAMAMGAGMGGLSINAQTIVFGERRAVADLDLYHRKMHRKAHLARSMS